MALHAADGSYCEAIEVVARGVQYRPARLIGVDGDAARLRALEQEDVITVGPGQYRVPADPYPALPPVLDPKAPVDYLASSGTCHPAMVVLEQPEGAWVQLTATLDTLWAPRQQLRPGLAWTSSLEPQQPPPAPVPDICLTLQPLLAAKVAGVRPEHRSRGLYPRVYSKEAGLDHVQGFDSLPQLLPGGRVMVYSGKRSNTMSAVPYWLPYQVMACWCADMMNTNQPFLSPEMYQLVWNHLGVPGHLLPVVKPKDKPQQQDAAGQQSGQKRRAGGGQPAAAAGQMPNPQPAAAGPAPADAGVAGAGGTGGAGGFKRARLVPVAHQQAAGMGPALDLPAAAPPPAQQQQAPAYSPQQQQQQPQTDGAGMGAAALPVSQGVGPPATSQAQQQQSAAQAAAGVFAPPATSMQASPDTDMTPAAPPPAAAAAAAPLPQHLSSLGAGLGQPQVPGQVLQQVVNPAVVTSTAPAAAAAAAAVMPGPSQDQQQDSGGAGAGASSPAPQLSQHQQQQQADQDVRQMTSQVASMALAAAAAVAPTGAAAGDRGPSAGKPQSQGSAGAPAVASVNRLAPGQQLVLVEQRSDGLVVRRRLLLVEHRGTSALAVDWVVVQMEYEVVAPQAHSQPPNAAAGGGEGGRTSVAAAAAGNHTGGTSSCLDVTGIGALLTLKVAKSFTDLSPDVRASVTADPSLYTTWQQDAMGREYRFSQMAAASQHPGKQYIIQCYGAGQLQLAGPAGAPGASFVPQGSAGSSSSSSSSGGGCGAAAVLPAAVMELYQYSMAQCVPRNVALECPLNAQQQQARDRLDTKVRGVLGQLVEGVACLESLNILHRNIQPASLLVCSEAAGGLHIKLADLSIAATLAPGQQLSDHISIVAHPAPEQLRGPGSAYDHTITPWQVGCTYLVLMYGRSLLFWISNPSPAQRAALGDQLMSSSSPYATLRKDSRDILARLLEQDAAQRPPVSTFSEPWAREFFANQQQQPAGGMPPNTAAAPGLIAQAPAAGAPAAAAVGLGGAPAAASVSWVTPGQPLTLVQQRGEGCLVKRVLIPIKRLAEGAWSVVWKAVQLSYEIMPAVQHGNQQAPAAAGGGAGGTPAAAGAGNNAGGGAGTGAPAAAGGGSSTGGHGSGVDVTGAGVFVALKVAKSQADLIPELRSKADQGTQAFMSWQQTTLQQEYEYAQLAAASQHPGKAHVIEIYGVGQLQLAGPAAARGGTNVSGVSGGAASSNGGGGSSASSSSSSSSSSMSGQLPTLVMELGKYSMRHAAMQLAGPSGRQPKESWDRTSRHVVTQLRDGLACLESVNVLHRDVKAPNLICCPTKEDPWRVKIADLGIALALAAGQRTSAFVGTGDWMAPEQLQRGQGFFYDHIISTWQVGCTYLELMSAQNPLFYVRNPTPQQFAALREELHKESSPYFTLRQDSKDFLKRVLEPDARKRPSITQLRGRWAVDFLSKLQPAG